MLIDVSGPSGPDLTVVYVNDFGDNYHSEYDKATTELEMKARKIRRRYKHIVEYIRAKAVYDEYMAVMEERHGGKLLFDLKRKSDHFEEFIPPKPRIKGNGFTKELKKRKIFLPRANFDDIDMDEVYRIAIAQHPNENARFVVNNSIRDKDAEAIVEKEFSTVRFNAGKFISSDNIDYLEEYFEKKKRANDAKKKRKSGDAYSIDLDRLMSADWDRDDESNVRDTWDEDDVVMYRGLYVKRGTVKELELYKKIAEYGWDTLKIMKHKGSSSRTRKIAAKDMKVKKIKKKKEKKRNEKMQEAFIDSLMDDSNYGSFEEYEKDMQNFTSSNIFGGGL